MISLGYSHTEQITMQPVHLFVLFRHKHSPTYLQFTKLFMLCEVKLDFVVITEDEDVPLTRVLATLGLELDKF